MKPALTSEEWAAAYERESDASLGFHPLHTELVAAADFGRYHQAAALGNAALPAGDPRKLTREDVEGLRLVRDVVVAEGADDPGTPALAAFLDSLAARLAALLPPETKRDGDLVDLHLDCRWDVGLTRSDGSPPTPE